MPRAAPVTRATFSADAVIDTQILHYRPAFRLAVLISTKRDVTFVSSHTIGLASAVARLATRLSAGVAPQQHAARFQKWVRAIRCPTAGRDGPSRLGVPDAPHARGMTRERAGAFSRRDSRVRALPMVALIKTEGTGNAGRWPHPWPACRKKAGGSHHRFSRDIPAFPARWFDGLYVLSPVRRAFWPPSPERRHNVVANLASASGCQDHTISPYASYCSSARKITLQHRHAHRIPHPTFVTIAKRPS
jgi:hypothetical protein